ncbi:MAG: alpha-hydroxy-acid oxidizing protein [Chloroflexi bacterium]|nr:alpha-hydroxy-acid oxidizing protein [Chloroflexota bacterium]
MHKMYSIEDARRLARRRLPRMIFEFLDGGADDESTLRSNLEAFDKVTLNPRVMVDVSKRDQATTILGDHVSLPVLLAPTGLNRLFWRDGELAVARAAGKAGTILMVSTASSCSIEEVAGAATGVLWFQLYMWRDRELIALLVDRAQKAGCHVMCVSVDVPIMGKRPRDLRNGMTVPPRLGFWNLLDALRRHGWVRDYLTGQEIIPRNLLGIAQFDNAVSMSAYINKKLINPGATWDNIRWIRELWKGPLAVKGIITAEDALRAVDCGVNGIVVSNHGGRTLDGLPATLDVLPEIVRAVDGRAEVFMDGGIRYGTDVIKAIALGARACLIGRPYLWGLAADGEAGVARVLEIFREEIDRTLAQLGRSKLSDVDSSAVRSRIE